MKVVSKNSGNVLANASVSVAFDGAFRGTSKKQDTGADGITHFELDTGSGTIFVNGKEVYRGQLRGRIVVYI